MRKRNTELLLIYFKRSRIKANMCQISNFCQHANWKQYFLKEIKRKVKNRRRKVPKRARKKKNSRQKNSSKFVNLKILTFSRHFTKKRCSKRRNCLKKPNNCSMIRKCLSGEASTEKHRLKLVPVWPKWGKILRFRLRNVFLEIASSNKNMLNFKRKQRIYWIRNTSLRMESKIGTQMLKRGRKMKIRRLNRKN